MPGAREVSTADRAERPVAATAAVPPARVEGTAARAKAVPVARAAAARAQAAPLEASAARTKAERLANTKKMLAGWNKALAILHPAIVHKDEPDHFLPYQRWLESKGRASAKWNERAADWCIHKILMLAKLPALFLDSGRERMAHWPDEAIATH